MMQCYFLLVIICVMWANCYITNHKPKLELIRHLEPTIDIPIRLHLDQPLTRRLQKQRPRQEIKLLTKTLFEDAERFFKHPSLKQRIKLKLLSIKFLKNNTDIMRMDENGSKYLKSYCDWQKKKKVKSKWFYSILLTGLDVYYEKSGKKIRASTARGYMNGMCNLAKSCTLIEWHPKNMAYLIAHEIAHSLGLSHDGHPSNKCKPQGFIMGAKYNKQRHPRVWSHCSRNALKEFLMSKKAKCLQSYNKLYEG